MFVMSNQSAFIFFDYFPYHNLHNLHSEFIFLSKISMKQTIKSGGECNSIYSPKGPLPVAYHKDPELSTLKVNPMKCSVK